MGCSILNKIAQAKQSVVENLPKSLFLRDALGSNDQAVGLMAN